MLNWQTIGYKYNCLINKDVSEFKKIIIIYIIYISRHKVTARVSHHLPLLTRGNLFNS